MTPIIPEQVLEQLCVNASERCVFCPKVNTDSDLK
jgi:hypothetical protein